MDTERRGPGDGSGDQGQIWGPGRISGIPELGCVPSSYPYPHPQPIPPHPPTPHPPPPMVPRLGPGPLGAGDTVGAAVSTAPAPPPRRSQTWPFKERKLGQVGRAGQGRGGGLRGAPARAGCAGVPGLSFQDKDGPGTWEPREPAGLGALIRASLPLQGPNPLQRHACTPG
jgi:hypothetical protein